MAVSPTTDADVSPAAVAASPQFEDRIRAVEALTLSATATRSYPAHRLRPEAESPTRTPFQRDRDRIVHSKSFRRLKHKTQVFVSPEGDHYRTRLTHTLEVCMISRTVARALALNEDLTEAISCGHDLGHPAFGHIGEAVLDQAVRAHGGAGFRHNEHSLRVVDVLERQGLNLTTEVRDGILNHTGEVAPLTLEGRIVKLVDRVAYLNHDIDDALRAGVLTTDELTAASSLLGPTSSERMDTLVEDIISCSGQADDIVQSPEIGAAMLQLRAYMFDHVYLHPAMRGEDESVRQAEAAVNLLFAHFIEHPDQVPIWDPQASDLQRVTDYLAGMSDHYCISEAKKLEAGGEADE